MGVVHAFAAARPGAVITFYQRARHLYGPLKLEVLDDKGKLVDTLTATKRRGINRVSWAMQERPPRVPRAAQLAHSASSGPRVLPGTYTVRLTKGSDVVETKLAVGLDRRAPFTLADRKANHDAATRAAQLFGDMSALVDRIEEALRRSAEVLATQREKGALRSRLEELTDRERDVMRLVAKGLPNKAIGAVLGISGWTVATHLRRVFAKLCVTSRAAMVAVVAETGQLED